MGINHMKYLNTGKYLYKIQISNVNERKTYLTVFSFIEDGLGSIFKLVLGV